LKEAPPLPKSGEGGKGAQEDDVEEGKQSGRKPEKGGSSRRLPKPGRKKEEEEGEFRAEAADDGRGAQDEAEPEARDPGLRAVEEDGSQIPQEEEDRGLDGPDFLGRE
jgi:hypothetical protein